MTNTYSRRYEFDSGKGVYDKIAENTKLKKIHGEIGDNLLIRGSLEDLILIEKVFNKGKETIKIHSKEPEGIQLELESIIGVNLSQYRTY